jgi:acyl carrier protein
MSDKPSPLTEKVLDEVMQVLATRQPSRTFARDEVLCAEDLRPLGLDSLGLVNLMMGIEDAFAIMVPQEAMKPNNFRSVRAVEALVASLRLAA